MDLRYAAAALGHGRRRPLPIPHAAIAPPFDANDPPPNGNEVHTSLPPEQIIPAHFADPRFMRADFNGVTLNKDRWAKLGPLPFLIGANSTPLEMLMTPMGILYPRPWQDAMLTEHAERGYDDFVVAPDGDSWNMQENGFDATPAAILAWCRYVRSWGFRIPLWRGSCTRGLDAMLQTLLDAGVVDWYIHGKEVDSQVTSEAYDASLQMIDAHIGGRLPIGAHFTANFQRGMGYPIGFPRDTFLNDWSPYNGRVHLMQQMDMDASAGLQGASMYYARRWINLGAASGVDGAQGPGAPDSRVVAFETMATNQLYGRCTEEYGNLRSWELLCGTRDNAAVRPVSGSGNGIRYPDGSPL